MNNSRIAHTIVIGNEKGGSGKSTTAMHIAVGLMTQGYRVSTIDVDGRQGTLSRYIANRDIFNKKMTRNYPTPTHHRVESHAPTGMSDDDIEAEAKRLELVIEGASLNSDVVLIDTPGAANRLSFLAHTYADTLITPLNDSFIDLDVLAHMDGHSAVVKGPSHYSESIWEAKKAKADRDGGTIDWIVMRNRLSNLDSFNKRDMEMAIRELSKRLGFRTVAGFSERVIFRELFLIGLTILDLKEASGGAALSRSHLAAREEIFSVLESLRIPPLSNDQERAVASGA